MKKCKDLKGKKSSFVFRIVFRTVCPKNQQKIFSFARGNFKSHSKNEVISKVIQKMAKMSFAKSCKG